MIAVAACYPIETKWVHPSDAVLVVRTAAGEQAVEAIGALSERQPISLLVSTGFCGAVDPGLRSGDLVFADVIRHRGEELAVAPELLHRVREALVDGAARIGPCESVSAVADGREKRTLGSGGAISVDMESGPLARWAADHRVPFLSARVVLDPLDVTLPFSTSCPVALSLARHPICGLRMIRLAVRAARRLGAALDELLPALKEPA